MTAPTQAELDWVTHVSAQVHRIGGSWFFADVVRDVGERHGVGDRFALYAGGRGGVIGDPTGTVVASAFAFFPPHVVIDKYRIVMASLSPRECAEVYASGLGAWARDVFGDHDDWDVLAKLGRRIADSCRAMGMPLFAGWRAMPIPDSPVAAMAQTMHVLREMRGEYHVHAVVASGMTPLEAIIGKDGPARARELFYPEPYPTVDEVRARRTSVEELTNRLTAADYLRLSPAERERLGALLDRAEGHLDD